MTIVELVPQTEVAFGAFWSTVGAANSVIALGDEDNTSWIQGIAVGGLTQAKWDLTSATLAPNQRVSALRFRLGVLESSGIMLFGVIDGSPAVRAERKIQIGPGCIGNPNDCGPPASAVFYSEWWPGSTLGGTVAEITQSVLDGLQFTITLLSPDGGTLQYASLAVEVDVRSKPTLTVNPAFGSPVSTLVSWTPTLNDGDVQSAWEVAVFSESQYLAGGFDPSTSFATLRVTGTGQSTSAPIPAQLVPGVNYRAYVRVAKKLFYGTTGLLTSTQQTPIDWFSDWFFAAVIVSEVATSNYIGPVSEGELGCHQWVVVLQERGGGRILAEIPWTTFTFSRVGDDMSAASVAFPYSACVASRVLASADEWTHELGIWRDTATGWNEEWVGPLTGKAKTRSTTTWRAKDLFAWFEHRRVHGDYTLSGIDLATIFAAFALDALAPDNSMGIDLAVRAAGVTGDRSVASTERRRAADLLRDLSRSGVSFTMIARTLLVAGLRLPLDALVRLIDEHTSDPSQDSDGDSAATDVAVVGKLVDDVQTLGSASIVGSARGVLESTVSSNEIEDMTLANTVAASNLSVLQDIPKSFKVPLQANCQNGWAALIPGAAWLVDLPSIGEFGTFQLAAVEATVSRQDEAVQEAVTATLQTLGATGAA